MSRLSVLTLVLLLSACASVHKPAERPYNAAETKQLALEVLSRRGLSYEDYEKARRALSEQPYLVPTRSQAVPAPATDTRD